MKLQEVKLLIMLCVGQAMLYCSPHNFIITSVPKSGTHLLAKFMSLLSNKTPKGGSFMFNPAHEKELAKDLVSYDNFFLIYHIPYTARYEQILIEKKFKILLITRDPRDFIVSASHWTQAHAHAFPKFQNINFNDILLSYCAELPYAFNSYLPWKNSDICYATTFEKLVGEQGGGDKNEQIQEMQHIAHFLGYNLTIQEAESISAQLFGGSVTFREGKIGSWKKHFTAAHKERFKKTYGQLLIDLKYETDTNW
jgi:sulfotransferase 6B1